MTSRHYYDRKKKPTLWVLDVMNFTMKHWIRITVNNSVDYVLRIATQVGWSWLGWNPIAFLLSETY